MSGRVYHYQSDGEVEREVEFRRELARIDKAAAARNMCAKGLFLWYMPHSLPNPRASEIVEKALSNAHRAAIEDRYPGFEPSREPQLTNRTALEQIAASAMALSLDRMSRIDW